MNLEHLSSLVWRWRERAEFFREHGGEVQARMFEKLAGELESQLRQWRMQRLTLDEAAAESGFSRGHLGRLVREEKIPNAGSPGSPRIRRCDLPFKARHGGPDEEGFAGDQNGQLRSPSEEARSVVESD